MKKGKGFFNNLKWINFVSSRFSRVDRNGRSAVTSTLATLGISFGVMTLIVVMSVMNGFQMSFIDSILEISSFHVRVENLPSEKESELIDFCNASKSVISVTPFYEAQTLMTSKKNKEGAGIIRAVDPDIYFDDVKFRKELNLIAGHFNLEEPNYIVLGSELAKTLGVTVGSTVNLLVLSGGSDVDLISNERNFKVVGLYASGYKEINASYAFVGLEAAKANFGENAKKIWGIKLNDSNDFMHTVSRLSKLFPESKVTTWKDYNKSLYGTLRIEKNMLLLLVALIFVVVAINIYNGMRRLVYERRSEIAILSALGAGEKDIKSIFIMRGFVTGVVGAFSGLILGLLISVNTDFVFTAASKVLYGFQYVITAIFNRENLIYVQENSTYNLYATIPARIFFRETVFITLFGIISPLFASWSASKNVLKLTVAEVLHNE